MSPLLWDGNPGPRDDGKWTGRFVLATFALWLAVVLFQLWRA